MSVFEEKNYRRDSQWGESSPKAFSPGLEILCNIEKAEVYLYDEYSGQTPYENNSLLSGNYRVKIVKTGYRTEEFSFYLDMSKRTVLKVELSPKKGVLVLNGVSPDTVIFANNQLIKPKSEDFEGNLLKIELPVGENKIRLERFGFFDENFSIVISLNKPQTFQVLWTESEPQILDFDIIPRFGNFFTNNRKTQKIYYFIKLNRAGTIKVTLTDSNGNRIASVSRSVDTPLVRGVIQSENKLSVGDYTISAEFSSRGKSVFRELSFSVSSKNLNRYQSVRSGSSGLLYAPSPLTLYSRSYVFSFEPAAVYRFSNGETSLPLTVSTRFSPYPHFEGNLDLIYLIEPVSGDSEITISTGCKYNIPFNSDLFSLAPAIRFTYNGMIPQFSQTSLNDPFSHTTGCAVLVPMELHWPLFRLIFSPEINIAPIDISDSSLNSGSSQNFSSFDIYSTVRMGVEFMGNGWNVALSGAFKTPGFVSGDIGWLSGYIGCEAGFAVPGTVFQINGIFFMEFKTEGIENIGGGIVLALVL